MVEYSAVLGAGKNWSPQSQKAVAALKGKYDDLKKAWDAGWRWYPVPAPKTTASSRPPHWRQSSGPVPFKCASALHGFEN